MFRRLIGVEYLPQMETSELKYWIAFSRVSRVGRARLALLEGSFGSLASAWVAGAAQLQQAGLDRGTAQHVAATRGQVDPDAELEKVRKAGVTVLTWHDEDYPPRLKEIYDKPPVLYIRGKPGAGGRAVGSYSWHKEADGVWAGDGKTAHIRPGAERRDNSQRAGPGN